MLDRYHDSTLYYFSRKNTVFEIFEMQLFFRVRRCRDPFSISTHRELLILRLFFMRICVPDLTKHVSMKRPSFFSSQKRSFLMIFDVFWWFSDGFSLGNYVLARWGLPRGKIGAVSHCETILGVLEVFRERTHKPLGILVRENLSSRERTPPTVRSVFKKVRFACFVVEFTVPL